MELTRQVLFEKSSPFWSYSNPRLVPEKLWDISFKRIKDKNTLERTEFIISKIICSIALQKFIIESYHVSGLNGIGGSMENRMITLTLKSGSEIYLTYHVMAHSYSLDISSLENGINLRALVIDYFQTMALI